MSGAVFINGRAGYNIPDTSTQNWESGIAATWTRCLFYRNFGAVNSGALLVANVWVDFDLIPLAGGMMRAVAGPPKAPPPPNPNSPLSLADARFWDGLLADAGFEFTDDHNFQEAVYFDLGNDEQSFKVAALPIWDTLAEMEASGSMPDAWAKAQSAFPEAAKPFIDDSGNISLKAEFRISVARKPAA